MPEFATPFAGMNADRKLKKEELVRAIRYNIAAEFEAIQLYMQLHDSINDEVAKKVLIDVANEEKEHVGEFMKLLRYLDPEEEIHYKKGEEEVEEIIRGIEKGI